MDVVAGGLFAIDVLACFAGPDGGEGMPVVGSSDGDSVHTGVGEYLTHVFEFLGFFAGVAHESRLCFFASGLIDIAQTGDAGAGEVRINIEVRAAPTAQADDGEVDPVIGAPDASGGSGGGCTEKKPACIRTGHC